MQFAGSEKCPECRGTGATEYKDGFYLKCPVCKGRKVVPILKDSVWLAEEDDRQRRRDFENGVI